MVKIAIVHEGSENNKTADKKLLRSLIIHLELVELDPEPDFKRVYFEALGSKSNFFKVDSYTTLKQLVEADQISKILLIVDADHEKDDAKYKGFENTERELQKIINTLGFADIARFYIVCNPATKTGYLESLILASLPEDKQKCIEQFIQCSSMIEKHRDKAIINHLYTLGYPNQPYCFDHKNFDDLKAKLTQLFEPSE